MYISNKIIYKNLQFQKFEYSANKLRHFDVKAKKLHTLCSYAHKK